MYRYIIDMMRYSETAKLNGIKNQPSYKEMCCMRDLVENVLGPIDTMVGKLSVNSGYRCEELNRMVGGVPNSQHMLGQAADIRCASVTRNNEEYLEEVEKFAKEYLNYDQLIRYDTFIHLSYNALRNRRQYIDKRKRR